MYISAGCTNSSFPIAIVSGPLFNLHIKYYTSRITHQAGHIKLDTKSITQKAGHKKYDIKSRTQNVLHLQI